jgi:hypothetical protein
VRKPRNRHEIRLALLTALALVAGLRAGLAAPAAPAPRTSLAWAASPAEATAAGLAHATFAVG